MAIAAARRPSWTRRILGREPIGALFVAPYVLFLAAIFAYPLIIAIYISFYDFFFAAPGAQVDRPFVGLGNYSAILSDPTFQRSLLNIGEFILINVPLTVALGLGLATALNAKLPFRTFFRAAYYVPYVTASVAIVGVFLWLFAGNGLVNTILGPLAPSPSWLVNGFWAMPIIALVTTWKQLGFYVLLYLAALQNIPTDLYEAAEVDGANRFQRFMAVTVPGVRPATILVVILATIVGANLFTEPYLLTGGGGPDGASMSPVLLMYQAGIEQGHAGYAAAIGVIMAILVITVAAVQRRGGGAAPPGRARGAGGRAVARTRPQATGVPRRSAGSVTPGRVAGFVLLVLGAILFLFPFYYMVVGSLQREPRTDIAGAFPNPANLTLGNFADINAQVDLVRTLINSGIFTGGVLVGTLVIGLLAGYALAQLQFRGRGTVFNAMLLILALPFQLFMIPLYVLIVRTYGLSDNYLGMILPFAVNATAVFIFRQFFAQLPRDLFDAARIDGASELGVLRHIAVPLARPAIVTAMIVTFIGPWNEFLWPFLITKQHDLQPLAVALANYISTVASRAANPFGSILAGAVVLVVPAVVIFVVFQRQFIQSHLSSGVKG